jgi:hypothetical protein
MKQTPWTGPLKVCQYTNQRVSVVECIHSRQLH